MNWEKLKANHYFKDPVEHVHASTLYDMKEYDKLYENQNNLNHHVWQEFDQKYKTAFEFMEDIREINTNKEIICVWFFKDRNDQSSGEDILLKDKKIKYQPNTFFITKSNDIKIVDKKNKYIRRPFVQLDLSNAVWQGILKRFNK